MRVCTIDGCDRKHRARGMCQAHYERWLYQANPTVRANRIRNAAEWNRAHPREHREGVYRVRFRELSATAAANPTVTVVATETELRAALTRPDVFATPGTLP